MRKKLAHAYFWKMDSRWDGEEKWQGLASRRQLVQFSSPGQRILRRLHSSQAKALRRMCRDGWLSIAVLEE